MLYYTKQRLSSYSRNISLTDTNHFPLPGFNCNFSVRTFDSNGNRKQGKQCENDKNFHDFCYFLSHKFTTFNALYQPVVSFILFSRLPQGQSINWIYFTQCRNKLLHQRRQLFQIYSKSIFFMLFKINLLSSFLKFYKYKLFLTLV